MSGRDWDVFVSYGHEDGDWVRALAANLHRAEFRVFLDEWELVGGDRLAGRLEEGIRGSANGVLVVSPHALSRPWVRQEYEALLRQAVEERGRRLIPVLYRDAELPAFLANHVLVDFRGATTGPGYDVALERLVRALRGRPAVDRPRHLDRPEWPVDGPVMVRPAGAMRLSLVIGADRVSLLEDGAELAGQQFVMQQATLGALRELVRLWRRGPLPGDREQTGAELDAALATAGRRLSRDVLGGQVGAALAKQVAKAIGLNEVLELSLQVPEAGDVPWETLQLPDQDGTVPDRGGVPLVLQRNVSVFREVPGLGAVSAHQLPGPLRILAVIGSPESQHEAGELLNYEAELGRIVAAVDPARRKGHAYVRVLEEGSLTAIRSALEAEPESFHVLHLSCHARPGELMLETADGGEDRVSASRLLAEGLPAGVGVPMVVLSGCSTGLSVRQHRGADPAVTNEGEAALTGIAEQLLAAGVPVVLAMQAPVSDGYAIELAGQLYGQLATRAVPDPLRALNEARREVELERQKLLERRGVEREGQQHSPDESRRSRAEWAIPALWVRGPRLPLINRDERPAEPPIPVAPVAPPLDDRVVAREVGEFVGRRQQLRIARHALNGPKAGLVIHGIGGVGKSTLAAEVITTTSPHHGAVISLHGELSIDRIFDEIGARLLTVLPAHQKPHRDDAQNLRAADIEWTDRWRVLVENILPTIPMIVLFDNFEDNLTPNHATWRVRDPELADLLARWIRKPTESKLLITARHPFELPDGTHRSLECLHLGPLSVAETAKLVWQLPGLDALKAEDRERAYRNVAGHPRTLEYLDALLQGGHARFDDIAERMEQRLHERGISNPTVWMATRDRDLARSMAEAVTLAVDDALLNDLLDAIKHIPLALDLVIGVSVFQVPIDEAALVWQLAEDTQPPRDITPQARLTWMQTRIEYALKNAVLTTGPTPADTVPTDPDTDTDVEHARRLSARQRFKHALAATQTAGLIAPVARADGSALYVMHRWTAPTIGQLHPELVTEAHRRAARYWRWCAQDPAQRPNDLLEQLIHARHHHHAADEHDPAFELSCQLVSQLQTWGHYVRATELCRQTLQWVPDDSVKAAALIGQLSGLASLRGDYEGAEQSSIQALEIHERLGDQAGIASCYQQLANIAEYRDEYEVAEHRLTQALEIHQRLGNDTGLSTSYHQLGVLAHKRGEYETAERCYTRALEIVERLRNLDLLVLSRANIDLIAHSYGHLGVLAQDRGEYRTAEQRYTQALEINELFGNQDGLAANYGQLGSLAQARGDYATAEQRYTQALEINEQTGNQTALAATYHNLGRLAQDRGDYETAEQRFTRSLEIGQRLGHQTGVAACYHQLGMLAQLRGDYETAQLRLTQALEISERLGVQDGLAVSYGALGTLAQERGDYATAEHRHSESLEIKERLGDQDGLASTYCSLGNLALDRKDYAAAEQRYIQAIEIFERLGAQDGLATCFHQLGVLAQTRGDSATAEQRYIQAMEIFERLGAQDGLAACLHQLGRLAQERGDSATAERRYVQALEIDERVGNQAGVAHNYHQLGELAHDRGDYETAEQRYTHALAIDELLGNPALLLVSYRALGRLAYDRGDYGTAERRYTQVLEINERLGNQAGLADSYDRLGTLAHDRGDDATAEHRHSESLEIKERLGDQDGLASTYCSLGNLALDRKDYAAAEQRYIQAMEIFERLGAQDSLAACLHQLGRLAQERGDSATAERRYVQALEINERLGNQEALGVGYARLATLMINRGDERALRYALRAHAIRMQRGDEQASSGLQPLAQLRSEIGRTAFARLMRERYDDASLKALTELLDQYKPSPGEATSAWLPGEAIGPAYNSPQGEMRLGPMRWISRPISTPRRRRWRRGGGG